LLKVLAAQHVEIQRLNEAAKVSLAAPPHAPRAADEKPNSTPASRQETFAAGSYVIRMDQPFSRIADALLDRQYWSPEDPQKHPYDDTGWSFGDLFNARAVRVTDPSILNAKMEPLTDLNRISGNLSGDGPLYAINNSGQISLAALVYALKGAEISIADEAFEDGGRKFQPGSLLIGHVEHSQLKTALQTLDLDAYSTAASPRVRSHPAPSPRIAFLHTWLYTQTEGWWRMAFDKLHVPYAYISTQTAAREPDLRAKYDVIIFAPAGHLSTQAILEGMPMWGNAMPWQTTALTPNLGKIDSTDDIRPGLGFSGVANLKRFVEEGGLLITADDTAQFAIDEGLSPGVFAAPRKNLKVVGSVLNAVLADKNAAPAYGYGDNLAVYSEDGLAFTVSNLTTPRQILTEKEYKRPTGRGGPQEEDLPEGRPAEKTPPLPSPKPWEATPLNEELSRNNPFVIPVEYRPTVILRYAEQKDLLLSGLLEGGDAIAERAVLVDAHLGRGNVLLFANNPVYRGETIGSYALVFNAILNFDHLTATEAKAK